ncbi:TetR/AcrR family transcriptional regulator [Actinomadura rupiterrae]|uniref:TetR/AcrR family transcriptional regulator n=1 Tax=Actinomadura rupiterrae TaxID=559627 RepID=UPI0020A53B97|nr:TetR/AcrR family transcriptional regulator [Actinomadura rupiterrae]MCP2341593.1 AcrR family transcriptional regulator [Actinomadura rupiterrae]
MARSHLPTDAPSGTGGAPRARRIRGMDAEQRRAQRRRQLLDAALDLFAGQGYAATSIEQLCQHAYVGTKGFYEVFESREDCYLALLGDITEHAQAQVTERFEALAADAEPGLDAERELVVAFAHAMVDDPRRAIVTFGGAAAVSPAMERRRRENRRWAAAFVESVWRRSGMPATRAMATGLVGGLFELIADWLLDADPADPDAVQTLLNDLTAFYETVRAGLTASRPDAERHP